MKSDGTDPMFRFRVLRDCRGFVESDRCCFSGEASHSLFWFYRGETWQADDIITRATSVLALRRRAGDLSDVLYLDNGSLHPDKVTLPTGCIEVLREG